MRNSARPVAASGPPRSSTPHAASGASATLARARAERRDFPGPRAEAAPGAAAAQASSRPVPDTAASIVGARLATGGGSGGGAAARAPRRGHTGRHVAAPAPARRGVGIIRAGDAGGVGTRGGRAGDRGAAGGRRRRRPPRDLLWRHQRRERRRAEARPGQRGRAAISGGAPSSSRRQMARKSPRAPAMRSCRCCLLRFCPKPRRLDGHFLVVYAALFLSSVCLGATVPAVGKSNPLALPRRDLLPRFSALSRNCYGTRDNSFVLWPVEWQRRGQNRASGQ